MAKVPPVLPSTMDPNDPGLFAQLAEAEERILALTLQLSDVARMAFGAGNDGVVISRAPSEVLPTIDAGSALELMRINAAGTDLEWFGISAGTGITVTNTAGNCEIKLTDTAVSPAAYTRASLTVDQQGRLTAASSGGLISLSDTTNDVAGVLATGNGGTGLSSWTQGDIPYYSTGTTLSKLAKDTGSTRYLSNTGASNNPAWAQVSLTTGVTGTLPATSGGTDQSTVTQGDLLYGSASNTWSKLAKSTTATHYLSNTGASNNPAWAQVSLTTGVTGVLPNSNGGFVEATNGTFPSHILLGGSGGVAHSIDPALFSYGVVQIGATGVLLNRPTNHCLMVGAGAAPMTYLSPSTARKICRSDGTDWASQTPDFTVTEGGTGLTTCAQGDLLYGSASNTLSKLAKDANATRYLSNTGASNDPAWAQIDLTNGVTGVLPEASGGTNQSTYTIGDILYASAANTLSKLAKSASATRYLSNTGASNIPAWSQIDLTNGVTGTLPYGNGGTGLTSLGTAGQVLATNAGATAMEWVAAGGGGGSGTVTSVATGAGLTGGTITTTGTISVDTNAITNTMLRQGAAKSVIGVTGNATANVADISASGGRQVLQSNSGNTAIAFQNLDIGGTITGTLTRNNGGTGLTTLGTALQVLRTNAGASAIEWGSITAGMSVDFQYFTASGTWTKPANAKLVYVMCVGGGGGGGSGKKGAAGTQRDGGKGGSAGHVSETWFAASQLSATETITIGAGGAGGASVSINSDFGNAGSAGGSTYFGGTSLTNSKAMAKGYPTGGAGGSTVGASTGSYDSPGIASQYPVATGAGTSCLGQAGMYGPGSGGGGSFYNTSNSQAAGGAGGSGGYARLNYTSTTGGGGAAGNPGSAGASASGSSSWIVFGGGGGGGYIASAHGGAGGAGGQPGGGGGGGGPGLNSTTNSGAGGAGGAGGVFVITYY